MIAPTATYRLQFRAGMTFDRAAELAPYFARLGVSHLYASPIFQATPGSTHGYDIIDYGTLDPELGGEEGFARLVHALKREGLKLFLDFVPNHMGASPLNPWWHDVLEWGSRSRYADHFDIDWSAPRLIVPALGKSYGRALAEGDFSLALDEEAAISFRAGDVRLPLSPPTYASILGRMQEGRDDLARRFAAAAPEDAPSLRRELGEMIKDGRCEIERALAALSGDLGFIHDLHEAQVWRLTHWRAARETLTYRRFFEISDLVGVRVERPSVFDAVHAKLLGMVREGSVHAIRIDHVDGLADPRGYLEELREEAGSDVPVYVEKILGRDEGLRSNWPTAGTTGYEFIAHLADLFVDPDGEAPLDEAYRAYVGSSGAYEAEVLAAKRRIITRNLAGELDYLTAKLTEIAGGDLRTRDFGKDTLRRAIIEAAAALPVYRSYVAISGPDQEDIALIDAALSSAKATREVEDESALDFLARVLKLSLETPAEQAAALDFTTRFQQTTSALAAKAVEDTVFYSHTRLLALNEVGGEPSRFGAGVDAFHKSMIERARGTPWALNATATHDTKRGEDARARLYALSEMPERWAAIADDWREAVRARIGDGDAPEPAVEWMILQAIVGHWPSDLAPNRSPQCEFKDRLFAYARKAIREAKQKTSWVAPDTEYEDRVLAFAAACIDPNVMRDVLGRLAPVFRAGLMTGYSQTLIKLTAPGIPDIYQGTEEIDLSFVDPDNRRPLPVARLLEALPQGDLKRMILSAGLDLRRQMPKLFLEGAYLPLPVEGEKRRHVVAFARTQAGGAVVAIAPRLCLGLLDGAATALLEPSGWSDTRIRLPAEVNSGTLHDVLSGDMHGSGGTILLSRALSRLPVALLVRANTMR